MEYSIMQVPTTQLAKMSIDLKFVEVTADVLEIFFIKYVYTRIVYTCVFFQQNNTTPPIMKNSPT